jgi:hypothetical protein
MLPTSVHYRCKTVAVGLTQALSCYLERLVLSLTVISQVTFWKGIGKAQNWVSCWLEVGGIKLPYTNNRSCYMAATSLRDHGVSCTVRITWEIIACRSWEQLRRLREFWQSWSERWTIREAPCCCGNFSDTWVRRGSRTSRCRRSEQNAGWEAGQQLVLTEQIWCCYWGLRVAHYTDRVVPSKRKLTLLIFSFRLKSFCDRFSMWRSSVSSILRGLWPDFVSSLLSSDSLPRGLSWCYQLFPLTALHVYTAFQFVCPTYNIYSMSVSPGRYSW